MGFRPRIINTKGRQEEKRRDIEQRVREEEAAKGFSFDYSGAVINPPSHNRYKLNQARIAQQPTALIYLPETMRMHEVKVVMGHQFVGGMFTDLTTSVPDNCKHVIYVVSNSDYLLDPDLAPAEVWFFTIRLKNRRGMRDIIVDWHGEDLPIFDMLESDGIVTKARRPNTRCRLTSGEWFKPMANCMYVGNSYA
jgi:hypothetical protein